MTVLQAQLALRAAARVGEGPVWDPARGVLRWVDIPAGRVHASNLATGHTTSVQVPMQVGAVALTAPGDLVVACEQGFGLVTTDGSFTLRLPVLRDGERMNDAKCDPAGRLWAGSTEMNFRAGRGALHRLNPDWTSDVVLDGLTLPNGMGWSPDSAEFYLADSEERVIEAFGFDLRSGTLSGRRTLVSFAGDDGMPDGLCVDSAGCLWVAMWGAARVLRITPRGEVAAEVATPVRQPSSCAFGGQQLDVLYVTSAREGLSLPPGSTALDGSIFAVHGTGATGTGPAVFASLSSAPEPSPASPGRAAGERDE